ncbi:hypothetical protein [Paraburkholderia sp. BL10I2N1]|uniref:hypothetical protein n=1 Tax=Paraburkholderia sp. BL10I2N1 TaxID=1938796 RepID=UPI00105E3706|nr:hypothetical protein [Paraburkholderia sp. BL10I2N1]TDN68915.1 hypothetical protein B0G77_2273 [Paraburkholderia sp. BL10I2N1]
MSTIPLTLIEGHIALPRARPFDGLPVPFGREWALLPPNFSVRPQLKALYAAMLRTFCLSADAIRSLCRWESHPAADQANVGAQAAVLVSTGDRLVTSTETVVASVAPSPSTRKRAALAGGAAAAGGIALLTWIALKNTPVHLVQDVARPDTTARPVAQPLQPEAQTAAATSQGAHSEVDVRKAHNTVAHVNAKATDKPTRRSNRHPTAHARNAEYRATAHNVDTRRHTASAGSTTYRSTAMPSAAGRFSSRENTPAVTDEYASITMWARPHGGDIAPSHHAARTDDTSWMDHMKQRRVTEVPERFAP